MIGNITALVEALKAEFEGDVAFVPNLPGTFTAPSVVVAPGDPFLAPSTHGAIEEQWDILTAVSVKEPGAGIEMMRDLSLRVRRTVVAQGALWRQATGPRRVGSEGQQVVVSVNTVIFRYPDPE